MMNPPLDKELMAKVFIWNDSQRNNEQSFDTSQIEMRRTCKYKPPLNISNLPSVFEMPKTNYNLIGGGYNNMFHINNNNNNDANSQCNNPRMQYSRVNLQPIKHIKANIKIVNDNPIEKEEGLKKLFKPQLKPIEIKDPRQSNHNKRQNYHNNTDKELLLALANKHFRVKSLEKYSKTSEYYYQMLQKMEPEQCKVEIKRLEKYLKDQDQSSLNKSMINDTNIPNILVQNKISPKKVNVLTVYNALDNPNQSIEKYAYCVNEFVSISSSNYKVLHIPTLKIYQMQKIPRASREDYIADWKTLDHSVLEIVAVFRNHPNGYDSIVSEMSSNGSIDNLIKTTGALNERIQRGIVQHLLPLIEYFNIRIGNHYDFIKASNIYFDNKFNIVLHPSLEQEKKELRIISERKDQWSKVLKISKSKLHMKIDLFSLGIVLFDINLAIINMKTRHYLKHLSEVEYKGVENCCCLYHFLAKLIPEFASVINDKLFSEQYIEFLCHITSFELTSSFSINKIKKEVWLGMKNTSSMPLYYLRNVIQTAKVYDFINEYYTPNSQIRNFDIICEIIRENMPFCEDYFNFYSIKNSYSIFENKAICYNELAKELRIDVNTIQNRLRPIYSTYFEQKKLHQSNIE